MNYDPITHQEALKIRADISGLNTPLENSGRKLVPLFSTNVTTSRTLIVPQDGVAVIRALGPGGSGAKGNNATGGYSGSWGVKAVRVKKGDTIAFSIGVGGAIASPTNSNGNAGGNTTVVVGGVTYTAYGGPGGVYNSASALPNGPSPSSNWDFGAASVKPGWVSTTNMQSGGAGVDILAQGNNATTSDASYYGSSGGGGTGGASAGSLGGGAIGTFSAALLPSADPAVYQDAGNGDWGISFYGGSGGQSGRFGANGGGGGGIGGNGGPGGGGGAGASGSGYSSGNGGFGGGGGGGASQNLATGGIGGNGFAHLKFFEDVGA